MTPFRKKKKDSCQLFFTLQVAWDATKLGIALKGYKQEKALVQSKKHQISIFRRKEAVKEIRRLYEAEKYEELVRLFVPDVVLNKVEEFVEVWWRIWDIYWIFILIRILLGKLT